MVGFFVGIIFFILTIPLRSAILILKTSIKTTEVVSFQRYKRRKKKQGEDVSIATDGIKKKKKIREGMTAPELALYHSQKLLLRALKTLLAVIQWIARLITCISVLVWIIVILFVVVMVACVGAIIMVIIGGDFNWSGGTDSNGGNNGTNQESTPNIDTSDWIDVVKQTQKVIASKKPNYFGTDANTGISSSQWTDCTAELGTWIRPDCSGIIYGMCQVLGVFPKSPDGPGDCFWTGDMGQRMIATGKFEDVTASVPTEADLQAGDVVIDVQNHTQIYMGGGLWINGGNTADLAQPDPIPSSFFPDASVRQIIRYKG